MAESNAVKILKERAAAVLKYDPASLVARQKWGEIDFRPAGLDIEKAQWIAQQIQLAPLEYLTDNAAHQIRRGLDGVISHLQSIDAFTLGGGSPAETRNQIVANLRGTVEELYNNAAGWVAFLAVKQGGWSSSLAEISHAKEEAEKILTAAQKHAEKAQKDLEASVVSAREASGRVGVTVFTQDFADAASDADTTADKWLKATIGSLTLTVAVAAWMWAATEAGLDQGQIIQKVTTKLFVLATLVTATIWCGRNYKALKHQATINRHRALSIRTFQAFSSAANDLHTKDAVLLETTRAVFGNVPTGYIDSTSGDGELKIVEVARALLPKDQSDK